ncbi:MAG TPA: hypothetical protein VFG20_03630, partial [Planctomycetaceae bacterium]|nr:hypothetical protein [Planctomycetaceae bacterium]
MRTRHWLKSLFSGLLLASSATVAAAQDGPVADPGQVFGPASGYPPYIDPASPQAAGYAVPYTGIEQAGYPPEGLSAWPQISPYAGPAVDQHVNRGGLWFNEQYRGPAKMYAVFGGGITNYGPPSEAVVGNPRAPGYFVGIVQTGQGNQAGGGLINIYQQHSWSDVGYSNLSGGAMQGVVGWDNPDGSGAFGTGFYSSEGSASYNHNPRIGDPDRPEDTLIAGAGISFFDGGSDTIIPPSGNQINGFIIPGGGTQGYDMNYSLQWQSQAYGAGVGFYSAYLIRQDKFQLRPSFGLRYINVRENALFQGQDSGLVYSVNITNTVNGGTNAQRRFTPTTGTVTGIPDVFSSRLYANTKEQLAGPEIGLRYDLGGDKFKIYGQSKFGLLANHSTREITGFGIGRSALFQTNTNGPGRLLPASPAILEFTPSDAQDPDHSQTAFHDQDTTTSASPTFEQ